MLRYAELGDETAEQAVLHGRGEGEIPAISREAAGRAASGNAL